MVKRVGEGADGASYCFGDAVVEGERAGGLVAGWEGDVLEFSCRVGDLVCFASALVVCYCIKDVYFSVSIPELCLNITRRFVGTYMVPSGSI